MRNSLVILIALISSCTKINQAKMNQNKNEYIFYKMVNDNSKYDYRHHEIDFSLKDSVLLKEVFEKAKQIHFSGYKNENPIEDSIQYDGFDFCQFKPENNKNKYKAFLDKDGKIISMTQVENSPNFYHLNLKVYYNPNYILLFPIIDDKPITGFLYLNKNTNRLYFISASHINMAHLYEFPSSITSVMLLDKDLYPNRQLKFNEGKLLYMSYPVYENGTTNMVSEYVLINNEKNITNNLSIKTRISDIDFYMENIESYYPLGDVFIADVNKIIFPIWLQNGNHQYSTLISY